MFYTGIQLCTRNQLKKLKNKCYLTEKINITVIDKKVDLKIESTIKLVNNKVRVIGL